MTSTKLVFFKYICSIIILPLKLILIYLLGFWLLIICGMLKLAIQKVNATDKVRVLFQYLPLMKKDNNIKKRTKI